MRKRNYITIISACLILLIAILFFPKTSAPVITYFPLDSEEQFEHAKNTLQLQQKNKDDKYMLSWKNLSETSKPFYLRQDVSLLFKDGALIGVKSIWEEDVKTIDFNETFNFSEDHVFQALTLHYGEKHYSDDDIKSLQHMSYDELYVQGITKDDEIFFREPGEHQDPEAENDLKKEMQQNLLHHWHRLTSHFNIDLAQYEVVPLTELHHFEEETLLSFSKSQTEEIIAKLWEGLYENYILPASEMNDQATQNFIPLILFDKHEHDILVLFELNGEMKKLKQQYPDF